MMKSGYSYTSYLQFTGEPKSFTYQLLTQITFILIHGLIGIGTSLVINQNINIFYYLIGVIWIRFPFVIISGLLYIELYFFCCIFVILYNFDFFNIFLLFFICFLFPFVIISCLLYIEPYFPCGNFEILHNFEFPNIIVFILIFISITYILFLLFQVCRKTFNLPFHVLFPLFLIQLIILEWGSMALLKFT